MKIKHITYEVWSSIITFLFILILIVNPAIKNDEPSCVFSEQENIPIVQVTEIETPTEAQEDNIEVVLGTGETSYRGSTEGRSINIEIGTERISGTVVLPDEEFSFIKSLGPVRESDGFKEERVFRNGVVTRGIGGGLCQVSTTLFQAILASGFPVTERQAHTYAVSYNKTGLDATVSNPHPDLRFKNDSLNPILIKGRTENGRVIFEILGIPDGRIASISEAEISGRTPLPETKYIDTPTLYVGEENCINGSQTGFETRVSYKVVYSDGTTKNKVFTSIYKPLQRICYRGTAL